VDISLKPELEKIITDEVQAGRSVNLNEFLNKAVYHYIVARDLGEDYTPQDIDRLIAEGLDDIERGKTIEGEEAFSQLRAQSVERRKPRG
jgi:hypothetical protein